MGLCVACVCGLCVGLKCDFLIKKYMRACICQKKVVTLHANLMKTEINRYEYNRKSSNMDVGDRRIGARGVYLF